MAIIIQINFYNTVYLDVNNKVNIKKNKVK